MKTHTRSLRSIGYSEIKKAQAQAAERARTRQFWINVAITVGLVLLYVVVAYVVAHWGHVR